MRKLPVLVHLLGLGLLLGSVACHILLSVLSRDALVVGDFAAGAAQRALMVHIITAITVPGLGLLWFSGLWRLRRAPGLLRKGFMRAKLVLVALSTLNGLLVLTPLSYALSQLATRAVATGQLPASYLALATREDIAGALNLLCLLSAIALAVYRPRRRGVSRNAAPVESPIGQVRAR